MKNKLHRHGAIGLASLALSAALAGAAFAGQGTTSSARATSSAASAASEPSQGDRAGLMLVLVPTITVTAPQYAKGCWVRFYDGPGYTGNSVTLSGPVQVPDADKLQQVWHDWDSAVVGPKARVVAYDNDNYKDRSATFKPGQHVPNLGDSKLGLFRQVNSVRVQCPSS